MLYSEMKELEQEREDTRELGELVRKYALMPMEIYGCICRDADQDPADNELCTLVNTDTGCLLIFGNSDHPGMAVVHMFSNFNYPKQGIEAMGIEMTCPWTWVPLMSVVDWDWEELENWEENGLPSGKARMATTVVDAGMKGIADLSREELEEIRDTGHGTLGALIYVDGEQLFTGDCPCSVCQGRPSLTDVGDFAAALDVTDILPDDLKEKLVAMLRACADGPDESKGSEGFPGEIKVNVAKKNPMTGERFAPGNRIKDYLQ